jgi:hypothetical protein
MTFRLSLFLSLVLGIAITADGQRMLTLNPVNIVGEVVQVGPRSVIVKAGDGKNWTVTLDNNTRVKIKGTAALEMIAPRTYVRFVASIDKHTCKAKEKLDKITLFTPTQGVANRTPGVEFAKDAPQADDDEAGPGGVQRMGPGGPPGGPGRGPMGPGRGPAGPGQGPLAGPAPDADNPATDEPPAGAKPKRGTRGGKSAAAAVPDVAEYEVCAQVISYHSRRVTVNVQNRYMKSRIIADLSPEAEVALDLSDLSTAKPGDKVSARGYYITPGVCQRTEFLTITLAKPLGEKPGRSHRARPPAKTGDAAHRPAGKGKPEPAPADQNPPAADDKAPATDEKPDAADKPPVIQAPKEKDDDPVMDDPNAKPQPAPQPKPDEAKPDTKKPEESAEKKPPAKNDEKDVFEK